MKKTSYLFFVIIMMIIFSSYPQSGSSISLDEMKKKYEKIKPTDLVECEKELKRIINENRNSESVLYIYYKLFFLYNHQFFNGIIDEKELENIKGKTAEQGIKTYTELSRNNNGKFSLELYHYYNAMFHEMKEEREKACQIYEDLIKKGNDLTPDINLNPVFYYHVKNLLKLKELEKATPFFLEELDKENQKKFLILNPDFHEYLMKRNLLPDSLVITDEEKKKIANDVELSKISWIYPDYPENFNTTDSSIKDKLSQTQRQMEIIKRRIDYIYRTEGFYKDTHITTKLNKMKVMDPFSKETIRYKSESSGITIWSNGPDEDNDNSIIPYDPTNGTKSNGDIIIKKEMPLTE